MLAALEASGTERVTVPLRRVAPGTGEENLYELLTRRGFRILPNTAGCYTAQDAILTAHLAREALGTPLIKLEVIADDQRLQDLGAAAVMPLAAPIGSGLGIRNPHNIALIRSRVQVPVIVDAGVGTASDVAIAFELGCDGVLLNSAIARAQDPVRMARAIRHAAIAGREAFLAGRMPRKFLAEPTSPLAGRIDTVGAHPQAP